MIQYKSIVLAFFTILLLSVSLYSQNRKVNSSDNVKNATFELLFEDIEFDKEIAKGEYVVSSINPTKKKAKLSLTKTGENPLDINYQYFIVKTDTGSLLDVKAALTPLDLRVDNPSKIRASKQKIFYPINLKIEDELPSFKGKVEFLLKQNDKTISYNIFQANRTVKSIDLEKINGKKVFVYTIVYDYLLSKSMSKMPISVTTAKVEEKYTEEYGIISSERKGKSASKNSKIEAFTKLSIKQ